MVIVSYCGGLSQSGARWSLYLEIHFESVDPTEMRSEFGLLGCILNIDSPENFSSFTSNIERRSVGFSETDEMWVLTVRELFSIACTSKEVIANLIRLFVGVLILGSLDVY